MKVPSSSLTSGSLGSGATVVASRPQVSSDLRVRLESFTVTCMVKELTGEAREKRARVANKAKVARLSSMTRKGFFAEEKPELESLHESRLIRISVHSHGKHTQTQS